MVVEFMSKFVRKFAKMMGGLRCLRGIGKFVMAVCMAGGYAVFLSGCVEYPDFELPDGVSSAVIDARDYETWVYFSFEKGGTVPAPEDFKNDRGWDMAFHRWDVRTNGGESGCGEGGAWMTPASGLEYEELYKLLVQSVKNMIPDGTVKTYMKVPDMQAAGDGDQRVEVPASTELARWMTVTMSTIPPSYDLAENVFFVRTASGKHAAVKFTNYMNEKAVKGYVNFEYIYPLD